MEDKGQRPVGLNLQHPATKKVPGVQIDILQLKRDVFNNTSEQMNE